SQVGTAIAGLVALVGQEVMTARQFAMIGLAAAVATAAVALAIRRSYAGALVDALHAGRPQVFGAVPARQMPLVVSNDAQAARALAEATRSPDVRVRRLALQLAAELPLG